MSLMSKGCGEVCMAQFKEVLWQGAWHTVDAQSVLAAGMTVNICWTLKLQL